MHLPEEARPSLKSVLVIGLSPTAIQLAREVAKIHQSIRFDVLIADEFDNTPDTYDDTRQSNLKFIVAKYCYTKTLWANKNNVKTIETDFQNLEGKFTINDWLKTFLDTKLKTYDFVMAPILPFQRWKWFQALKSKKPIFCSSRVASDLEWDKLFAKQILQDAGVPTPKFRLLDNENLVADVSTLELPAVVKCNIAFTHLGYGSWVFNDTSYTRILPLVQAAALEENKSSVFYTEDFVNGPEISAHFLCNGYEWQFMGAARDYKKRKDNDQGANTAGAGSYAPAETWTDDVRDQVYGYMDKLLSYLSMIGIKFRGIIYLGIIVDPSGQAQVLEINTRPGSPEFHAILKTMDRSNLLENLYRATIGAELLPITHNNQSGVAITLLHKDYTPDIKLDAVRPDFSNVPEEIDFSQGMGMRTAHNIHGILVASGESRTEAAKTIYDYLSTVDCNDYNYRTDIGYLK